MDEKKRCSVTSAQDCSATPCPRGEKCLTLGGPIRGWELFFETNGDWQRLAGLEAVTAPGTIAENLRFDTALPSSGTLRLHASGHSLDCREGQLYGTSLRRTLQLYGFDDGPKCLQADSHDIGAFEVSFGGPDFGSGGGSMSYVTSSVGGAGGSCSASRAASATRLPERRDADRRVVPACTYTVAGGSQGLPSAPPPSARAGESGLLKNVRYPRKGRGDGCRRGDC